MSAMELPDAPRILVIRRDNIGDLLCTTPLLAALRGRYPAAHITVLTNSYSAPVLAGNPHIDAVLSYDKGKHVATVVGKIAALWRRLRLIRNIRHNRPDLAILAASTYQPSAYRFAKLAAPVRLLGYPENAPKRGGHEAEATFALLGALGIEGPPPPMVLRADATLCADLVGRVPGGQGPLVGFHLSARKPSQRWPVERFAELARRLHAACGARFLLFWAPGSEANPLHPGDDEKAAALTAALAGLPALPIETHRLPELIAGLSLCDRVVCSDGGAMHIAAALGKPIVCFFGNSDAVRWHPWGVPYVLLQKESRDVGDVSVDEAAAAFERLG
ncbi:MAG: glycosyltransferase family 9 protein [Ignavibacteria bacterium]